MITHEELFEKFRWEINSGDVDELKDRRIYVLWSGGLDSTALLYCLAHIFPDKCIIAVSLEFTNAQSCKTDKECRKKLKRLFKKERLNISYCTSKVSVNTGGGSFYGLGQPIMWLMSLGMMSYTNMDAAVCFGYIKSDVIWHYMEYFKKAFYNLTTITGNTKAALYFPLG